MKHRIYVDKLLCKVVSDKEMMGMIPEKYAKHWAELKMVSHKGIEIKRWAGT